MKGIVWKLALVCLAACAAEAGDTEEADGSSPRAGSVTQEGWWVEIEAAGMEIPRLEGRIIVASVRAGATSTVQGGNTTRPGRASLSLIMQDFPGETGTLESQALTASYGGEPAYACRSRAVTLEIESVDPFQATFEGTGECWEGEDVAPDDPNNPGERLAGTEATIRGSIVE